MPIVPGTRVTEAVPQPPVSDVLPLLPTEPVGLSTSVVSRRAPSGARSQPRRNVPRSEARRRLTAEVVKWLDPDVPSSWSCPQRLLDAMVLETRIEPHVKDYGTLYVAELTVDSSPGQRAALVEAYNRELVSSEW